jgi:WD40 repeat protein
VNSVAISRDGGTVVSGSDDKTVRIWDAATGKQTADPIGPTGAIVERDGGRAD